MHCIRNTVRSFHLSRSTQILENMSLTKFGDFAGFKKVLDQAKDIIVLTGAGISAESGIPVFRGPGGLWRTHRAMDLATPTAFRATPGLVWEFYHYRRNVAFNAKPNKGHLALKMYEDLCRAQNRKFTIITQNVDGLHIKAGSDNVLEIHGSLRKVRCTKCQTVEENITQPLCEALKDRGDPDGRDENLPMIKKEELPKCTHCRGILRPHIVWFGENLDPDVMEKCYDLVESCDLCLLVGTSSVVFPAAQFAPAVASRGKPVAEFNINKEPASDGYAFHFAGPCGTTLPKAFGLEDKLN